MPDNRTPEELKAAWLAICARLGVESTLPPDYFESRAQTPCQVSAMLSHLETLAKDVLQ